jgi:AraC-like DNA-binding protein
MTTLHFSAQEPFFDTSLAIRGLGLREAMPPGQVSRPVGAGYWLLLLFHSPVAATIAGQATSLGGGALCLLRPETPHCFGDVRRSWSHSWLLAQGDALEGFVDATGLETDTATRIDPLEPALDYLKGIYRELSRHTHPRVDMLADWIHLLLRELARATGSSSGSELIPTPIREVRLFMEKHLDRKLQLEDLARRAHLSKSQFIAVFRRHYGRSPISYLLGLRMRRAALLLQDHSLSVSQVASAVGVEDPLYFSRLFGKHMGQSPTRYRRRD